MVAERAATILCTIEVITAAAVVNIKHNVTKNNPPVLDDSVVYETWRKEIELWQEVTDIDKKKQAVTIYFALRGKARDACIEISKSELLADDGVSKLIKKLDDLFLIDKNRRAFLAYQDFDKFRRPSAMSISDFTEHGMSLPDAMLAFRL